MNESRTSGPTMRAAGALAALAAVLCLAFEARAEAAIYWDGGQAIHRANLDGSHRTDAQGSVLLADPGFIRSADHVCGIAVNGTHIFWGDIGTSAIGRANLDGSEPNHWFITGVHNPCLLAVGQSHLFWTNEGSTVISRANLDGSQPAHDFLTETQPEQEFPIPSARVCGAAVDGSYIYWANDRGDTIGRAKLDGSAVEPEFIPDVEGACGVAVNGSHIYWGNITETVGRATLDGTEVDRSFIEGLKRACGIALDETYVYWWEWSPLAGEAIGRARLDGTEVNRSFLSGMQSSRSCSLAVDSLSFAPPPPPPPVQSACQVGKVTVSRRRPVVRVYLVAPAQGEIAVVTRGLRSKVLTPPAPPHMGGRRPVSLKVWLAPKGKAAKRLRRRLGRTGKAPVTLRIRCHGLNETPTEAKKQVTLRRFVGGAGKRAQPR